MKRADVIVVGGSAAGLTAAITARRYYSGKNVLLVRREEQVLIPCGIPYIFGSLGSPDKNLMPDALLEKNGIELLITEATHIDGSTKDLTTRDGHIAYDRLILATGSYPAAPHIPGVNLGGVFHIRKEIAYLRELQQRLSSAQHVLVIGGGFIGIELADEIHKAGGQQVTIVEIAPHCLNLAYDEEFCIRMEEHVRKRGVAVRTGVKVERLEGSGCVERAMLSGGEQLPVDVVILAVGVVPNSELAKTAGIDVGRRTAAIVVDQAMRTSVKDIFACGDCAKKMSFFGGIPSNLRLASIATSEARIAGANLFGVRRENIGTVGVWSTAVGDLALGTAGLTETMARAQGYDTVSATVEGPDRHPGGMPGASPMAVKLVFERHSGVIIGGQVAGSPAAGEVINALSACIQSRMTADEMARFQIGTHPLLTASPVAYPIVNAAEIAISKMQAG
ncbi:MAG: FAD-dependent oxidoreductase [Phycisphaerae bacterium]|nr:FAD-dependent oxidoreductase [Phycisphaerae bacterium]